MKNITYYNAGAGSGKTYTLTNILAEKIKSGDVKPEQVILTTFTDKAAAEFRERSKQELYKRGRFDEALALDQAMIGTVHSVANSFIQKFWYHLGIATDLSVMSEEDSEFYLNQSLSTIPEAAELEFLHQFADEFGLTHFNGTSYVANPDFWKAELKSIVEKAENYSVDSFDKSRDYSLSYARQIFNGPKLDLDKDLISRAIKNAYNRAQIDYENKPTKTGQNRIETLKKLGYEAKNPTLKTWLGFPTNLPKSYQDEDYLTIIEIKRQLWTSQNTLEYIEKTICTLFDMAERWMAAYKQYKVERHLIDYNDMETLFMELLTKEEVKEEIRQTYKYLFVDEFQDSSPIQVRIFDALSELVEESYWVGDPKQAIYGFRGADTELTTSVVDMLASDKTCTIESLNTCHRSVPEIIKLVNDIFVPAFDGILTREQVYLNAHRESIADSMPVRYWPIEGKNEGERAANLVDKIRYLLAIHPDWKYNDVAVLARKNDQLNKVAACLQEASIPVCRESESLSDKAMIDLLKACLQLTVNEKDNYARLRIAFYTVKGSTASYLMDEKLLADSEERTYLADVPLIQRILELRPTLLSQSVSSLLDTLIVETEFSRYAKAVTPSVHDMDANLLAVSNLARAYDEHCVRMAMPATIQGFIDYMDGHPVAVCPNQDGVQLFTIHGSKGLEWKCVILMGADEDLMEDGKVIGRTIFGVHHFKQAKPTRDNLFPEVTIHYLPSFLGQNKPDDLFDNITKSDIFKERRQQTEEEYKRLLYVALTRPRDILVISSTTGKTEFKMLEPAQVDAAWLKSRLTVDDDCENVDPDTSSIEGQSLENSFRLRALENMPQLMKARTEESNVRDFAPSKAIPTECQVIVHEHEVPGERISVSGLSKIASEDDRYRIVGDCIHHVFCGIEHLSDAQITTLIASYGLAEILSAEQLRAAWNRLMTMLQNHFGTANATAHERAFRLHKDGQILIGSIDLLYQLSEKEVVLIDHKTCPAGEKLILNEDSTLYAGKYSGQFAAYRSALSAADVDVKASLIYYPISGMLVEIK